MPDSTAPLTSAIDRQRVEFLFVLYEKLTAPQPSESSETDKSRDIFLKKFRAYLHLAITAKQTGQVKHLEANPGPNMMTYCRALAELPDNTLAGELADSVSAIFDQINKVSLRCGNTLRRRDEKSTANHAQAERILEQLDFGVALILRHVSFINRRAGLTECQDLLIPITLIV